MASKQDKPPQKRRRGCDTQQAFTPEEQNQLQRIHDQGDLKLRFEDGTRLKAGAAQVSFASPFFAGLLGDVGKPKELNVDFSPEAWKKLLLRVYPMHSKPTMTMTDALLLLPLAHKYDFAVVMAECQQYICRPETQRQFSSNASSEGFILRWLQLADQLQLDKLRATCLLYVQASKVDVGMGSILSNKEQLAQLAPQTLVELVRLLHSAYTGGPKLVQCSACHLDVWPAREGPQMRRTVGSRGYGSSAQHIIRTAGSGAAMSCPHCNTSIRCCDGQQVQQLEYDDSLEDIASDEDSQDEDEEMSAM